MSYRNRELLNLTVVGALTAIGFASVYIARQEVISTSSLSYAGFFFALYLAAHGVVKLAIVLLLMRRVALAYPLGIVVFSGFIVTQLHRWSHTHSPVLLALSALDLVVIGLTWREWRGQRG